jgi:hypothetical protein
MQPSSIAATHSSPSPPVDASGGDSGVSASDDWKSQYETQVRAWRADSAAAREKAEKERARWEKIRESERFQGHAEGTGGSLGTLPSEPTDITGSKHSRESGKVWYNLIRLLRLPC